MKEIVTTMDLRHKLGEILNRVDLRQEQFVVKRKGKLLAAIIPIDLFNEIQGAAKKHALQFLDELSGKLSDEEAMSLADEIKKDSRRRRRAKK